MYTLTYIYTSIIYQIKQSVLLSYIFIVECKTLRSIYSISLDFIMHVLNDRIRNNSVKNCARYIIFVPKCPAQCPLEHAIQNSILMFPT